MANVVTTPQEHADQLAKEYATSTNLNEADTRHRIIDILLHNVLCWPRAAVECESFIDPGYADYMLVGRDGVPLLFVEAKKEGVSFTLPIDFAPQHHLRFVKLKTLLTDGSIRQAATQVWQYCSQRGCEYAAITNGHQWIFFKTFERHRDWRELNAFVATDLRYFSESFIHANTTFSYTAILETASLSKLLGAIQAQRRDVFYPKSKITTFNQEVTSNHLAPLLRPLAERYLGAMDEHDDEFMARCYVNVREYHASVLGVNQVIYDCLSPYFKNYNVKEFFDDSEGGEFGKRLTSNLRERRTREVIVLFGGKGSGKSTFIRKLLYHRPPNQIKYFSVPAVIDLLECPQDAGVIQKTVWSQLIERIDCDHLLRSDRATLLKLFEDNFLLAQKQTLAGFTQDTDTYNSNLNALVAGWLKDREYCAIRLADYWKRKQKGLIIVLDNTDQFSPEIQDYCFTLAHQIATLLDCLVVISMREERFHYSKIHGTLDAFQNSGFHLSSPPPQMVFFRRLRYILQILDSPERARKISPELSDVQVDDIKKLIRVLLNEFRSRSSHLNSFLRATAHGNMRIALELFRQFLLSGYTRVDEMIQNTGWTLQVHQVIRPMMVPYRFFYQESLSNIPNIYQIRSESCGSHFTALRILSMLSLNMSPTNPVYIPLAQLRAYFANLGMLDDLHKNLDVLLRTGIIESNNRVDEYRETIDALKITPYGYYITQTLCSQFNYLDLVALDCGIHEESTAHSLAIQADKDIDLFFARKKMDRLQVRLQRTQEFINYLIREEQFEAKTLYLGSGDVRFGSFLQERFSRETERVMASARKNYGEQSSYGATLADVWD